MSRSSAPPIAAIAAFAIAGMAAFSLFDGKAVADTKGYSETGFTGVSVSAGVNVVLKQGPYSISADGTDKDIARLDISRDGDVLRISRKSGNSGWSTSRLVVTVTAPTYTSISASSGADVEGQGLKLGDVEASSSSGADLNLSGACKAIKAEASSGADLDASGLTCETGSASASSGADVDIYSTGTTAASASSGGDVTVHGKPANVARNESSGGDVTVK